MSFLDFQRQQYQFNRGRTLALLDRVEQQADPAAALGFRPGPGRAHVAWQLLHVAITEELFATERFRPGTTPAFADLAPRYRGGSTPDDDIPTAARVREVLAASREHLLATLAGFSDSDLDTHPVALRDRTLTLRDALKILAWHEPHHQGQAHVTLNIHLAKK